MPKTNSEKNRPADATRLHPDGARQLDLRSRLLPRDRALAVDIHQDRIEAHNYLEHGKQTSTNWRSPTLNAPTCSQTGCPGLAPAPELLPYV